MAKPVTPEELATIKKCLKTSGKCDLGKGSEATIDVAESEDINNPYHSSLRAIYILMSIREPTVKSITLLPGQLRRAGRAVELPQPHQPGR